MSQAEVRQEGCSCGGSIAVALPATDEDITRAVRAHQGTTKHLVWRQRGGLDNDGPRRQDAYEDQLR